jgi:hypothetical protein
MGVPGPVLTSISFSSVLSILASVDCSPSSPYPNRRMRSFPFFSRRNASRARVLRFADQVVNGRDQSIEFEGKECERKGEKIW